MLSSFRPESLSVKPANLVDMERTLYLNMSLLRRNKLADNFISQIEFLPSQQKTLPLTFFFLLCCA